jgi:hypothetical protein
MDLSRRAITCLVWLFVFIFLSPSAKCQNFSLGIKAGPSLTWVAFGDKDTREEFGSKPKVGFAVGGVISFPLKNNYSFLSEAGFKQQGRRVTFYDNTWENNATYQFIDMSMALRKSFIVKIRKDVSTRAFFNVGPDIGYWLNGKGEIKTDVLGSKYTVVFDKPADANFRNNYMNEVNRWIFGMDIGFGLDANITKTQRVTVEMRFNYGHTYIGKKNGTSSIEILGFEDNIKANFKTLTLTGTYFFDMDMKKSKLGKSTKDSQIKRKR